MLKDKQTVMGLETCEKMLCKQTCEDRNKTNKNQGFQDNGITHARTSLRMHEFSLCAQARSCVRRSLPRNPNQHRNRA